MPIRKINARSIGTDVIVAEDIAANAITVSEISSGAVTPAKLSTGGPYWDTSTNFAIAHTSPDRPVHLKSSGNRNYFKAETTVNAITHEAGFEVKTTASSFLIGSHGDTNALWIYDANGTAERLRINSSGHLLIGTQSSADGRSVISNGLLIGGAGTVDTNATPTYGGIQMGFRGSDNLGYIAATNPSSAQLAFFTKSGGGSAPTERMRIHTTGAVAVGTTSTAATTATKLVVGGGVLFKPTYGGSLSSGGNFMFNLLTHCGSTFTAGTIRVLGTENQINQTYAEYDFVMARYVWDGSGFINYQVRLIQRKRLQINNGYGSVFLYLPNYSGSWTTTDQSASSGSSSSNGSTSIFDIYARNEVGQACSVAISVEYMDV